jgi:hypothetical protein
MYSDAPPAATNGCATCQRACIASKSEPWSLDTNTSGMPDTIRPRVASPTGPASTPSTALKITSGTDAQRARSDGL